MAKLPSWGSRNLQLRGLVGQTDRRVASAKPTKPAQSRRVVDTSPQAAAEQRRLFEGGRKNKKSWPAPQMPT